MSPHSTYDNDNTHIFSSFTWKITASKNQLHNGVVFSLKIDSVKSMPGVLKSLKIWAQVSSRYTTVVFAEKWSTCIPPPPHPPLENKTGASPEREERQREGVSSRWYLYWLRATSESVIAKTILECGILWSYSFDAGTNWKALWASSALLQGGKSAYTNYEPRLLHTMNKLEKFKLSTQ